VAIDLSAAMIEKYKARIVELGPMQKNTSTLVGNLLSDPPEPPTLASEEYQDFHLITVGQALHQLPNDFGKCLAKLLRPGGVLYVQDLLDDGHHQGTETTRPRGLTLDDLRSVMSGAGLIDCRFEVLPDDLEIELPSEEVLKVRYFVARAMKPKVKRQPIPVH
jgi:SAM-dependent methyltransferase